MRKIVAACLLVLVLIAGSVFAVVQQGDPKIKVWVKTASNVYHCPGSQFYGKTQRGRYMLQKTAQKKGIRPAEGQVLPIVAAITAIYYDRIPVISLLAPGRLVFGRRVLVA